MRRVHAKLLPRAALVIAAASLLAACGTVGADQAAGGSGDSTATKVLLGNANPPPITAPQDLSLNRQCPPVEILQGAAAYPVYETAGVTDPFSLRYQATIADTARECSALGVEAAIRVGLVGRVILGPKGAPGAFRVPLRIAVLDEAGTPVYSENHFVDVTVPAGQAQADFSRIEEGIVVPIPQNRFRGWRIVVGYDPAGAPASKPARRRNG